MSGVGMNRVFASRNAWTAFSFALGVAIRSSNSASFVSNSQDKDFGKPFVSLNWSSGHPESVRGSHMR
ncbi:hypothetical protein [Sphingobium yanoikuyae]|uniref:hypothetical protein n=1 Tax=Sphingobium yanoikuyae TaxID=13690 RepID=UPI00207BC03F|nr:hypothetical protein [Sphingobium yanoikuyae]